MPIINIHMLSGRTNEQKRALVRVVTDAVTSTLMVKEEKVKIIITEMEPTGYAIAGKLIMDTDSNTTVAK
ncbi:MAG: 2-hydroxymuconate tautomerase family protein [Candidatus Midichloria sp.]|nr:2-hydroxymuconate tautomerase family protein [Candidatus Midichloria sp.]